MPRKAAVPEAGTGSSPLAACGSSAVADLSAALAILSVPGIHTGWRRIAEGDEDALLPSESAFFQNAVVRVRRQSGAARLVARALLQRTGRVPAAIPKSETGAPFWPEGVVGSLAHDATFAVAAVATARGFASLGIDIEPDLPLPDDLTPLIATPDEQRRYDQAILQSRLLFAAKEAVYKAVHPLDGIFLDFQDVEVDLFGQVAEVRYGRRVAVRVARAGHVVALAWASVERCQPHPSSCCVPILTNR